MKRLLFTIKGSEFETVFNLVDKTYNVQPVDIWDSKEKAAEAMKTFLTCIGDYSRNIQEASHVCTLYTDNGITKARYLELGFNIGSSYEAPAEKLQFTENGKHLLFLIAPHKE